jgi:exodeoxyribonuclease-3
MRIATFNINNVNKRLANLLAWLALEKPDAVCLQELKAESSAFPIDAIRQAGYDAVWRGERSWNGVAILARGATPVLTRGSLPGDPADRQARYIEAAVQRLIDHGAYLMESGLPVVLAGDYNVVPTEADIYPGHRERTNALLQPESRAAFARLLGQGWTDALRQTQPQGPLWTFWGYLHERWPRDKGMRLDHTLLSPNLAACLSASGVSRATRAEPNASDHAPVWVELSLP